ncbi:hypothetical protein [Providencia sp. Me31A]|uniref:hypothetical protein n=1 Tax=Providencia sp. Me31A TaxID=3392637 RepID=UPI003D26778C
MNSQRKAYLRFFMIMLMIGNITSIKNAFADLAVNQSLYGQIQVYVNLLNTACNLSVNHKEIMLTRCGAGDAFNDPTIYSTTTYTPVKLQFYNVENAQLSRKYSVYLANGDNKVSLPFNVDKYQTLRLEVNYE